MRSSLDDLRMIEPQCHSLQPVVTMHENNWFSVKSRGGYYVIEYNVPSVTILPIVDHHSIIMVNAKRPVIADSPLELPAGGAERSELPVAAAMRELQEETGIVINNIDRFQLLAPIVISSNRFPVMGRIYQIDITLDEFTNRISHDDEIDGVVLIPFDVIKAKIISGEIYIGLSIAIISRFLFLREGDYGIK
jgi:8-oxo-dGTP pyrophosphatase MutT (NUDIX family)